MISRASLAFFALLLLLVVGRGAMARDGTVIYHALVPPLDVFPECELQVQYACAYPFLISVRQPREREELNGGPFEELQVLPAPVFNSTMSILSYPPSGQHCDIAGFVEELRKTRLDAVSVKDNPSFVSLLSRESAKCVGFVSPANGNNENRFFLWQNGEIVGDLKCTETERGAGCILSVTSGIEACPGHGDHLATVTVAGILPKAAKGLFEHFGSFIARVVDRVEQSEGNCLVSELYRGVPRFGINAAVVLDGLMEGNDG